ncbi:MAG: FHA domain-containing protein [bacterium]|nr:FHA domain-containing protein [bacterium]
MLEFVYEDGDVTHRVPVRDGYTIGRSSDNDVVLRDFSVSRHHAEIKENDGAFTVTDLESTNGVKVNETFVTTATVAPGDQITIGSFCLLLEDSTTDASGLSSATYLRPLSEFNQDYGLEGEPSSVSKELGARERVFEILAQVAKTLLQVEDLNPVLEKVMDVVFDHLLVDRGYIVLFDDGGEANLELSRARESKTGDDQEVPISTTILDMVTRQKVALLTHDAQTDQRFEAGRSIRIHQIRSAMCAPLWHRERVIGAIYVDSPLHVGSFSAPDLDLLTALSNYAAVAIERARLNEHIRKQQAFRTRLERYHSPAVIDSILDKPEGDETNVTVRETTILFADIVGFTARCEALPPEEVASFLNQFFSLAADTIFEYGGTLDKFIGDAAMAFFGAPLPQEDHAERAVRSGLALQQALERWNRERAVEGLDVVEVRVAIHSGPVVVGDIGSEKRVDYTVLGNTVNVAARLEEFVAEPGQVVIGETTQASVAHLFPTEHLGNMQLKGLSRKIAVYRVASEEISRSGSES